MTPFTTARTSMVRLLPPGLAGGINGAMVAHSSPDSRQTRLAFIAQPYRFRSTWIRRQPYRTPASAMLG